MPVWHINDDRGRKIVNSINIALLMYEYITVADVYDEIALHEPTFEISKLYIENKYGWSLSKNGFFKTKRVYGGYTIVFDEPSVDFYKIF